MTILLGAIAGFSLACWAIPKGFTWWISSKWEDEDADQFMAILEKYRKKT